MSKVTPEQRFGRKTQECPICTGTQNDRRRRGQRCFGFLSADGRYAHCTREEYAGTLSLSSDGATYAHRLDAPCKCGQAHGTFRPPAPPIRRTDTLPKPPTWRGGAFPPTYDGGRYVAEWEYEDAGAIRRYSVIRYDQPDGAKTYLQARWRDDGQVWAWGLGETERLLYRLPALRLAPMSRPVFIGEGEKCADSLRGLGLVATTCSEGAGKWRQVPGRHDALRGRHVVILPDNDETGKAHARDVSADLAGVAASARIVELPGLGAHGDVADWLAAGHTKDELLELAITSFLPVAGMAGPINQEALADTLLAREAALLIANERRRELEKKDSWQQACTANPHLSATTKHVASAVRNELERANAGAVGAELTVYLPRLAKRAGVSAQTAGEALKKLAEAGTIARRVDVRIGLGGQKVSRVTISPTALFATPATWMPPVPRNHGGRRCPHCGGTRFRLEQIVTCTDCGAIVERKVSIDELEAVSPDAERPEDVFTGSQLDFPLNTGEGKEKGAPVSIRRRETEVS